MAKPLPHPTPTEKPFFDACKQGRLILQRCDRCNHFIFYPRVHCNVCHTTELTWCPATGKGTIASYTVVHRSVSSDFKAPYVVALIDLHEGPRMMSQIVGADLDSLEIGMAVTVDFESWSEAITMPIFLVTPGLDKTAEELL
tara:strand:+ start:468 stop:893 length:426 start_codon:yes stop_codon:yes gene_type:complete